MATFIKDLAEQAMAEDLAYLGEQEPKLTLCPLGVINAYSKDNLATPQVQIDLRQHLAAAWPVLLDQLREQGIPIPQQLQTPHFFGASETACVTTTRKALEVSAWIYQFTGNESFRHTQGNANYWRKPSWIAKTTIGICVQYLQGGTIWTTEDGRSSFAADEIYFGDATYGEDAGTWKSHVKALADSGNPLTIVVPLADPIRIQYSDLGLPDINSGMIGITTDHILTLSDTDGLEMHRLQPVEWTDEEGNTHPALITRYSHAYMDKHHAWPPALPMTYTGLQFTADYKEMRWLHDTVLKLITKYPV